MVSTWSAHVHPLHKQQVLFPHSACCNQLLWHDCCGVSYPTGLRLQVSLSYINRRALCQAVKYLSNVNRNLRDSEPQCALPAGVGHKVVYDIMLLRLGLRLIGKSIIHLQQDHLDGGNAVLNTVRDLQPEEITIPRQLWELAGTVQWFYPDHSRPLSEQLDQLSEFLWRNTTCHREEEDSSDDGVTGEQMQYARCTLTVLAK